VFHTRQICLIPNVDSNNIALPQEGNWHSSFWFIAVAQGDHRNPLWRRSNQGVFSLPDQSVGIEKQ